jgi:hypothetical protein
MIRKRWNGLATEARRQQTASRKNEFDNQLSITSYLENIKVIYELVK